MQQPPRSAILKEVFADILKQSVTPEINNWLLEKAALIGKEENAAQLNLTFATLTRKTGRQPVTLGEDHKERLRQIHPEYLINDWSVDRLSRVWVLLQVDSSDIESYFRKLKSLFQAAEMNELVALYSALIGLDYAEDWQKQCSEGIRSNIGIVLEAIMYHNPYPYLYLNEAAWNQLVMKAFFTEKDVNKIIGLDERVNRELASILVDYANERRSAHRAINPQLWRLVAPFIDATNFNSIERAFAHDPVEKKGAALACYNSSYPPAKELLEKEPQLKSDIVENKLNWTSF